MLCPHCKKPIDKRVPDKAIKRARKLQNEGYSFRDIERALSLEGYSVAASTLCRRLKVRS